MFRIALIQNTSEMRNYSFADLRVPLAEMGFEVAHYTCENITSLCRDLSNGIDCVVFVSNSLHDDVIRNYVYSDEFCAAFDKYLEKGAALIMHQHKLAKVAGNPLPFLGDTVEKLEKDYHGANEDEKEKNAFFETAYGKPYFSFPNSVTAEDVLVHAESSPGIPGDYWQVLKYRENTWLPIMTDKYGNSVIQRMAGERRVIFSSVLLDYQQHYALLENLLINLLTNNMSLAVFKDSRENALGFSYFLNHLENMKFYFRHYGAEEKDYMLANIECGVHSGILVGSGMMEKLSEEDRRIIDRNGVKLIKLRHKNTDGDDFFEVHTVDKTSCLNFAKAEIEVQQELAKDPKDSSFLVRADLLSAIMEFKNMGLAQGDYSEKKLRAVLDDAIAHIDDKNGSYDNTYGATCKALWLFYTFLGKNSIFTKAAYEYIKDYDVSRNAAREQLEKYLVLSLFEDDAVEYMKRSCAPVIASVDMSAVNEYDLLMLFRVALMTDDREQLKKLVEFIGENVNATEVRLGIYVAACTTSLLIDAYGKLSDHRDEESLKLCRRIEELLFTLVKHLHVAGAEARRVEERLRIACALYKFENITAFPVADLAELLYKTGTFPNAKRMHENYLNTYQQARVEKDTLKAEKQTLTETVSELNEKMEKLRTETNLTKPYKPAFYIALSLLVVALYFVVYLVIMLLDTDPHLFTTLFNKAIESWPAFFGVLIIPLVKFIFDHQIKKRKK
ncbi:MAG: hypothetical protein E7619_01460 [Ruminococcaceae bacterium]|nr:hypothetical protein [Oscillospiraceae bacterium]